MVKRGSRGAALFGLVAGGLLAAAGCPDYEQFAGGAAGGTSGVPCKTAADCDDKNACTDDACTAQGCAITPKDGAGPDDANDCTVDACTSGHESHAAKPDQSTCTTGVATGACVAGGCVVKCTSDAPCDDKNACTTDSCDLGSKSCIHGKLNGPEPGVTPKKGDCKQDSCVDGAPHVVADDTDVPDAVDCKKAACSGGVASLSNLPADTACGVGGKLKCDGKGVCANCASAADCAATQSCEVPACTGGSCVPTFAPAGTEPADQQTPNDCQKIVCDGSGNPASHADAVDPPKADGNPCTVESCVAGAPVHDPAPNIGKACPGGVCDGSGACVGCVTSASCDDGSACTTDACVNSTCAHGVISCNDSNPCTTDSCDPATGCAFFNNSAACDDGSGCTIGDGCQGGACAGIPIVCTQQDQCHNAGTCSGGVCSNPAKADSTPCDDGDGCTGNDECKIGVCQGMPKACMGGYTCSSGACGSCVDAKKNGFESDVDCGGGIPCPACANGKACIANADCASGNCTGAPKACK